MAVCQKPAGFSENQRVFPKTNGFFKKPKKPKEKEKEKENKNDNDNKNDKEKERAKEKEKDRGRRSRVSQPRPYFTERRMKKPGCAGEKISAGFQQTVVYCQKTGRRSFVKILIVEDEKLLAQSLKTLLENKGFQVEAVYDGISGAEYALLGIYDLLILDVMMPGLDGYQVARRVRASRCGVPILMLTAKSSLEDRIEGLNAGADYYLTKPFDTRELLACINALLRRQGNQIEELVYGNTSLELGTGMLVCGDKRLQLSAREFDVMRFLLQSRDQILPKEAILARVWGYDSNAVENHVEVYVGFLRKKLLSIGSNVRIVALRRLGYRLEVEGTC